MFDELLKQVILQFPAVLILLYIMKNQEKRLDDMDEKYLDCLDSLKNDDKV
jgi:hypothetical protein